MRLAGQGSEPMESQGGYNVCAVPFRAGCRSVPQVHGSLAKIRQRRLRYTLDGFATHFRYAVVILIVHATPLRCA